MATADKLLEKMRNNPAGDFKIENLQTVADKHSVNWKHKGTNHCVFRTPSGNQISVPARRPIKPAYIKMFINLIDKL